MLFIPQESSSIISELEIVVDRMDHMQALHTIVGVPGMPHVVNCV